MKSKNILNIFLLISLLSGLFVFQPANAVQALPADQVQGNLTGLIAYIGQDGNVRLRYSDGSDKPLTNDGGYEGLTWSPNGLYLALTKSMESGRRQSLFIKDLTEKPAQKLSDNVYSFAWDLPGNRIAYGSDQIHIIDVKNNMEEKIIPKDGPSGKHTPIDFELEFLFWNLWGDNLIYYSEGIQGIHQVHISSLVDTILFAPSTTDHLGEIIAQLQYDPFSGYFFGWDHSEHNYGIPLLISPSGELTVLEEAGSNIIWGSPTAADWFPDGKRLVYGADGGYLFSVDVDLTVKPLLGNGMNPRWSPDGQQIAFTTERGGLDLLDVNNQQVTNLLPDVSDKYLTEMCGFDACGGYSATAENEPRWSPDGKNIILPFKIGFFIYNLESKVSKPVDGGISPEWQPIARINSAVLNVRPENFEKKNLNSKKFPIKLSWRTPENLPNENAVSEFEVRMSKVPLDESNWNMAEILKGIRIPQKDGSIEMPYDLSEEYLHKKLFFGVKSKSIYGKWSPLSNVVEYVDSGFRPNVNGYQFSNGEKDWGTYPDFKTLEDFTAQDFYNMFKDNPAGVNICIPNTDNGANCKIWYDYYLWIADVNLSANGGRCLGMAATSAMIFDDPSLLTNLVGEDTKYLYNENVNLEVLDVRKYITKYQIEQKTHPYIDYVQDAKKLEPKIAIKNIQDAIISGQSIVLTFGADTGQEGAGRHAVVPISVSSDLNGFTIIYIYDNASPGIVSRIRIYPGGSWIYSENIRRLPDWILFTVPVATFMEKQIPPSSNAEKIYISVNSKFGSITLEDLLGNRIGTFNNVFVNEIPNAEVLPIVYDNEFGNSEPVYLLPSAGEYKMRLMSADESASTAAISQFGKDYAVVVEGVRLPSFQEDIVKISSDGSKINYETHDEQVLSIKMTSRIDDTSYLYQFVNINVESGKALTIMKNMIKNELTLLSVPNKPFDLVINRQNSAGEKVFSHKNIQFVDATSVAFDVNSWNGNGSLDVSIDYDGDGKYDEVTKISNQESFVGRVISYKYSGFLFCGAGFALFLIGALGLVFVRRKVR